MIIDRLDDNHHHCYMVVVNSMVGTVGFEPTILFRSSVLSAVRMPIPPRPQIVSRVTLDTAVIRNNLFILTVLYAIWQRKSRLQ